MADDEGYIYKPNVNVIEEMTNMISASRSYQTNVQLAESAKNMVNKTLLLGKFYVIGNFPCKNPGL